MGREAAITYEQVAAAADTMKAGGIKPTSRAIRERLGNVGSMGTINKLLQRWKAGQERQISNALALPPVLQRAILDFMDQELTSAKAVLEADLAEQQQEAADLATENERQASEIEDKAETILALQAETATLHGRIGQMETDLSIARDEAGRAREAAEAARTELAKALLRLEAMPRLAADLEALRAELEKERQARITAEQSAAVLASQKTDLADRLAEAKAIADRDGALLLHSQENARKLAEELADARVAVQAGQARIESAAREVEATRKNASEARAEAKKSGEEAAELRGKLSADNTKPASEKKDPQ